MYKPIVGLEIHTELKTNSKMFCSCLNDPNERHPNINICPICTAQPGTLPVINEKAVKMVIKTGLALNCEIPEFSNFDRKNYFYPDLPKGYQISQLYNPLCRNGYLNKIKIREIHLEEDTGRLLHEKDLPAGRQGCSLVDFNRAGVPLMELVTEPDINSGKEASDFAKELRMILKYLSVSDADMEKGQMRVEVNISLTLDAEKLGTKVEVKNLNSFRSVGRAIDYEIGRQKEILDSGKKIIQETRGWDDIKSITFSQREKEEANDYRYFPEPDLPPLHLTKEFIAGVQTEIPELPGQKRERLRKEYKLDEKSTELFIQNRRLAEYFEKAVKDSPPGLIELAADFLINTEALNYNIPHGYFSQLLLLIKEGKISKTAAKGILPEIIKTQPLEIIKKKGLEQINNEGEAEKIIEEIMVKNPKTVEDYKSGKANALHFLVGQVMAASRGKANPQIISDLLVKILKST